MSERTHEEIATSAHSMVLWTMFDHMPKSEYDFAKDYLDTLLIEVRADERESILNALNKRIATHRNQIGSSVYKIGFHAGFEAARDAAAARGEGQ